SLVLLLSVNHSACAKKARSDPEHPHPPKTGATLYVPRSGNDSSKGTKEALFRTIGFALTKANAGDTVWAREGTYHEKIRFPKSGRLDKFITLKAFPDENPIIDGTGLVISNEALVTISQVNYIRFEGFEVSNYKSSVPGIDVHGIVLNSGSSNIQVVNNKVHHIESNVAPENGRSGHGILVLGNTDVPMRNILIEGNEI